MTGPLIEGFAREAVLPQPCLKQTVLRFAFYDFRLDKSSYETEINKWIMNAYSLLMTMKKYARF